MRCADAAVAWQVVLQSEAGRKSGVQVTWVGSPAATAPADLAASLDAVLRAALYAWLYGERHDERAPDLPWTFRPPRDQLVVRVVDVSDIPCKPNHSGACYYWLIARTGGSNYTMETTISRDLSGNVTLVPQGDTVFVVRH